MAIDETRCYDDHRRDIEINNKLDSQFIIVVKVFEVVRVPTTLVGSITVQ